MTPDTHFIFALRRNRYETGKVYTKNIVGSDHKWKRTTFKVLELSTYEDYLDLIRKRIENPTSIERAFGKDYFLVEVLD